jgi:hypothetical protein
MRIRKAASALAIAALFTAVTGVDTGPAAASAGPNGGCIPTWKAVAAPPGNNAALLSISALSANDVWFGGVGRIFNWLDTKSFHWDGKAVGEVRPPEARFTGVNDWNPGSGVSSFSSDADGWSLTYFNEVQYADRWHGGRWTQTPMAVSSDPYNVSLQPSTVATISATDAWAFGENRVPRQAFDGNLGALIEHWDGIRWSVIPNPASSTKVSVLRASHVFSATDILAVGRTTDADGNGIPLVEHWDGTRWSVVPIPSSTSLSSLFGIGASGPNDVWVVGNQLMPGSTTLAAPLAEHWNGVTWSVVTMPDLGNAKLTSVYASGPSDVWATIEGVGLSNVLLHWDGTAWTTVQLPGAQEVGNAYVLWAVNGSGPHDVWVAGEVFNNYAISYVPYIVHLSCGKD